MGESLVEWAPPPVAHPPSARYHTQVAGTEGEALSPTAGTRLAHMDPLKLIALDDEDLAVLAAHLQDAVMRVGDMAWLPADRRFAAVLNRFDWADVVTAAESPRRRKKPHRRWRSGLRFERVLAARVQGIDLKAKDAVLNLLTIQFEPAETAPEGHVTLFFSAGGAIRLHVECLEAELKDLGAAWRARASA